MVTSPAAARANFPSGLIQPEGSFRFSLDALLLASFAVTLFPSGENTVTVLDLGCGSGVIGLACLLQSANARALGADREPELTAAAAENAELLGLSDRYAAICCDFCDSAASDILAGEKADVVLANMPYRQEGTGRLPRSALRRRALFADNATMPAFLLAGKAALKPGGSLGLIYPWEERERLFNELSRQSFFITALLPVSTKGEGNTFCLVSACPVLDGRAYSGARLLPPLRLRERGRNGYTAEAADFCPWL